MSHWQQLKRIVHYRRQAVGSDTLLIVFRSWWPSTLLTDLLPVAFRQQRGIRQLVFYPIFQVPYRGFQHYIHFLLSWFPLLSNHPKWCNLGKRKKYPIAKSFKKVHSPLKALQGVTRNENVYFWLFSSCAIMKWP